MYELVARMVVEVVLKSIATRFLQVKPTLPLGELIVQRPVCLDKHWYLSWTVVRPAANQFAKESLKVHVGGVLLKPVVVDVVEEIRGGAPIQIGCGLQDTFLPAKLVALVKA